MKRKVKKLLQLKKLQDLLAKYNLSYEYIAVSRSLVTKAILIGLFVALLPIPMQMFVVILLMKFFTFNVPVGILLCWISNPITMPFLYYLEYKIGSYILGTELMSIHMSVEWFTDNFSNIFIQLYLGAFVLAIFVSGATYLIINYLWIYLVYKKKKMPYKKRSSKI